MAGGPARKGTFLTGSRSQDTVEVRQSLEVPHPLHWLPESPVELTRIPIRINYHPDVCTWYCSEPTAEAPSIS